MSQHNQMKFVTIYIYQKATTCNQLEISLDIHALKCVMDRQTDRKPVNWDKDTITISLLLDKHEIC